MKTPKEQAEEMARNAHFYYVRNPEVIDFDEAILSTIPLEQLLEVARAATDARASLECSADLKREPWRTSHRLLTDALTNLKAKGGDLP
jgi:hypothetical protein